MISDRSTTWPKLLLVLLAIQLTVVACAPGAADKSVWEIDSSSIQLDGYRAGSGFAAAVSTAPESNHAEPTIITMPQPHSLRTTIIRWLVWIVLLTTVGLALIGLHFLRGRRRLLGAGLLALFLITYVPPFSYAPDPLGIVLRVTGGYHYDPRLPLVNRYLIAGDPTAALRPPLDTLIRQTGSQPLAQDSPLARYEFVSVHLSQFRSGTAIVHVRFTYEDGNHLTYPLTLSQNLTAARQ